MGHAHTLTPARASKRPRRTPGARVLDVLAGTLLLVLLIGLAALGAAVWLGQRRITAAALRGE